MILRNIPSLIILIQTLEYLKIVHEMIHLTFFKNFRAFSLEYVKCFDLP